MRNLILCSLKLDLKENATFYSNVQTLRKYWTDYDIKKLREPYDKNEYVVL
jgi:predicted metalloendopeptidase